MILICPDEYGEYDNKIFLRFPDNMLKEHGGFYYSKQGALIDLCVAEEIRGLWDSGITTYGSCCGHGLGHGIINVDEKDVGEMLSRGYEKIEVKGLYPHTFIAKSKHKSEHELSGR